jgi:hypothetical protein
MIRPPVVRAINVMSKRGYRAIKRPIRILIIRAIALSIEIAAFYYKACKMEIALKLSEDEREALFQLST